MYSTISVKKGDTNKVSPFFYLPFLFFFFTPYFLLGQESDFEIVEVSFGYPILQEQLPENYSYNPLFLTARFPIFRVSAKERVANVSDTSEDVLHVSEPSDKKQRAISFYAEPQFAITTPPETFKSAFEFGVNLGIQYPFWKTDKIRFAVALGVGPHFLSLETDLQHRGFLFSDNIELAYYQLFSEQVGIHFKTRFRHLSNANLQKPNLGIDNLFLMVGVFWKAKKYK